MHECEHKKAISLRVSALDKDNLFPPHSYSLSGIVIQSIGTQVELVSIHMTPPAGTPVPFDFSLRAGSLAAFLPPDTSAPLSVGAFREPVSQEPRTLPLYPDPLQWLPTVWLRPTVGISRVVPALARAI